MMDWFTAILDIFSESAGVQSLWKPQTKQSAPSAGRMCTF